MNFYKSLDSFILKTKMFVDMAAARRDCSRCLHRILKVGRLRESTINVNTNSCMCYNANNNNLAPSRDFDSCFNVRLT